MVSAQTGRGPYGDAKRASAVASALDENNLLVADANGGWRLQDAMIAARLLEPLDRVIFEEPCPTMEERLHARSHMSLPMVLDEVITDVQSVLCAHQASGMEGINLKISKFGGLTGSKMIRELADALGLRVTLEDTWGGDLVSAAGDLDIVQISKGERTTEIPMPAYRVGSAKVLNQAKTAQPRSE